MLGKKAISHALSLYTNKANDTKANFIALLSLYKGDNKNVF